MAKEWVLNKATNRWGLNKKSRVGPVAQWIREVAPRDLAEWEQAYYTRLAEFLKAQGIDQSPQAYLRTLGERLYVKITEVLQAEIQTVTLEDCVSYIQNLVIQRTFEGYQREIKTVYEYIVHKIQQPVEPAPDEIDRRYQVDFLIPVGGFFIGLQIKPVTYQHMDDAAQWSRRMEAAHRRFQQRFGGRVFVIFSTMQGRRKVIVNPQVIDEIRAEIHRLHAGGQP